MLVVNYMLVSFLQIRLSLFPLLKLQKYRYKNKHMINDFFLFLKEIQRSLGTF